MLSQPDILNLGFNQAWKSNGQVCFMRRVSNAATLSFIYDLDGNLLRQFVSTKEGSMIKMSRYMTIDQLKTVIHVFISHEE